MDTILRLLVGGLFALRGIWMLYPIWHKWRTGRLLNEHDSRATNATITWAGRESKGLKNGLRRTYYSYTVDGTRFDGIAAGDLSRRAPEGLLPIRYLADQPSVHEIVSTSNRLFLKSSLTILLAVTFILAGLGFALFGPQ
ncbi:MAG: hypothetical protein HY862_08105 [Chloroflexi bacterium]|nr:hypothetical protein [Chloroflexota bacterium]